MSRYDSDVDFNEYLNGSDPIECNAVCTDCGADYSKGDHDPTTWCDACSDRRDAHTDALEIRMADADQRLSSVSSASPVKVRLKADTTRKEVA